MLAEAYSLVDPAEKKYVMDDKDYEKRDDTFRKFKERQIAANPIAAVYRSRFDSVYSHIHRARFVRA